MSMEMILCFFLLVLKRVNAVVVALDANCRLDGSVFNYKQRWNDDKCKCECKELSDKGA